MKREQTEFRFTAPDAPLAEGGGSSDPAASEAATVSELLGAIRATLDERFRRILVVGEVSGFRQHASGHCYFVLKDAEAQIRAVLWRTTARRLSMVPKDGMQVEIRGRVEVYPPRGEMQLVVDAMRLDGDGAAQAALEALKRQLHKEGLFSRASKKPLPRYPRRIGVATSGSGAALHDITSILARRYPLAQVIVRPVRVQGVDAPADIADAINEFNRVPVDHEARVDVLVVGRGGGSAEDLWAFNEEVVARAIHASDIPVVSAVGHETDVTIADFVADVRAATPSMAAEVVTPDGAELVGQLLATRARLEELVLGRINALRQRVDYLAGSYHFRRTLDRLNRLSSDVAHLQRRAHMAIRRMIGERKLVAQSMLRQVQASDPLAPLRKGYALISRDSGGVVTSAATLRDGDAIRLRFHDGNADARVTDSPSGGQSDEHQRVDGR